MSVAPRLMHKGMPYALVRGQGGATRPLTNPVTAHTPIETTPRAAVENLRRRQHFLIRGIGWLEQCGVQPAHMAASGIRENFLRELPTQRPDWRPFLETWSVPNGKSEDRSGENTEQLDAAARRERTDSTSVGKGFITSYFTANTLGRHLDPVHIPNRYRTLVRAVTFVAFMSDVADRRFLNPGTQRGVLQANFRRLFDHDYRPGFLFDTAYVEPIIYKPGGPGDDKETELFGRPISELKLDPSGLVLHADLAAQLQSQIIDRDPTHFGGLTPAQLIGRLYLEERCTDLAMLEALNSCLYAVAGIRPAPRVATTFRGPTRGIINERFLDIRD